MRDATATPALSLRGLTKRYDDGLLALEGFDLEVPAGEFFGLLGPNGAGKTTLISAVCNLIRVTAGEIRVFGHHHASLEARRLVGLAGTVTTVAAVELGLASYDPKLVHHFVLTRAAAEDVFRTLATEGRAQRVHNPGLEEARADVIVGGTAILVAVFRYFDFDECLVSEADILDGLVLSLGARPMPG